MPDNVRVKCEKCGKESNASETLLLADGRLCKDCSSQLSCFSRDWKNLTIEDVNLHIKEREKDLALFNDRFKLDKQAGKPGGILRADFENKLFYFAFGRDFKEKKPVIYRFDQLEEHFIEPVYDESSETAEKIKNSDPESLQKSNEELSQMYQGLMSSYSELGNALQYIRFNESKRKYEDGNYRPLLGFILRVKLNRPYINYMVMQQRPAEGDRRNAEKQFAICRNLIEIADLAEEIKQINKKDQVNAMSMNFNDISLPDFSTKSTGASSDMPSSGSMPDFTQEGEGSFDTQSMNSMNQDAGAFSPAFNQNTDAVYSSNPMPSSGSTGNFSSAQASLYYVTGINSQNQNEIMPGMPSSSIYDMPEAHTSGGMNYQGMPDFMQNSQPAMPGFSDAGANSAQLPDFGNQSNNMMPQFPGATAGVGQMPDFNNQGADMMPPFAGAASTQMPDFTGNQSGRMPNFTDNRAGRMPQFPDQNAQQTQMPQFGPDASAGMMPQFDPNTGRMTTGAMSTSSMPRFANENASPINEMPQFLPDGDVPEDVKMPQFFDDEAAPEEASMPQFPDSPEELSKKSEEAEKSQAEEEGEAEEKSEREKAADAILDREMPQFLPEGEAAEAEVKMPVFPDEVDEAEDAKMPQFADDENAEDDSSVFPDFSKDQFSVENEDEKSPFAGEFIDESPVSSISATADQELLRSSELIPSTTLGQPGINTSHKEPTMMLDGTLSDIDEPFPLSAKTGSSISGLSEPKVIGFDSAEDYIKFADEADEKEESSSDNPFDASGSSLFKANDDSKISAADLFADADGFGEEKEEPDFSGVHDAELEAADQEHEVADELAEKVADENADEAKENDHGEDAFSDKDADFSGVHDAELETADQEHEVADEIADEVEEGNSSEDENDDHGEDAFGDEDADFSGVHDAELETADQEHEVADEVAEEVEEDDSYEEKDGDHGEDAFGDEDADFSGVHDAELETADQEHEVADEVADEVEEDDSYEEKDGDHGEDAFGDEDADFSGVHDAELETADQEHEVADEVAEEVEEADFGSASDEQADSKDASDIFGENSDKDASDIFGENSDKDASDIFGESSDKDASDIFGEDSDKDASDIFGEDSDKDASDIFGEGSDKDAGDVFGESEFTDAADIFNLPFDSNSDLD